MFGLTLTLVSALATWTIPRPSSPTKPPTKPSIELAWHITTLRRSPSSNGPSAHLDAARNRYRPFDWHFSPISVCIRRYRIPMPNSDHMLNRLAQGC
ncbi:hypothetical protein BGZ63DRAFT_384105 [Mariannaea sp. PMI_226]|nr:hypothetical protein BGZ63DRAFT_384105 [Mariannaea sp. PMI_226]